MSKNLLGKDYSPPKTPNFGIKQEEKNNNIGKTKPNKNHTYSFIVFKGWDALTQHTLNSL